MQIREVQAQREMRSVVFDLRSVGDDGSIEGYGSMFGVKDSYDDVIAPGSFVKSLKDHKAAKTMPAMLWQHSGDEPCGVWTEMSEDDKGLKVKGQLVLDTTRGREAHALLKARALNGLSIGFMSKQWEYDAEKGIRTLTEVDLWEVSLVTFPANPKARITSVKAGDVAGISSFSQAEKVLRDAGFSNDAAKAFIAEVKRLTSDERDARESLGRINERAKSLLSTLNKN